MSFNPRLTSAARRTDWSVAKGRTCLVSIRASLQQRGEPSRFHDFCRPADCGFNPRLTSAARRTSICVRAWQYPRVSIRASLQQRGERVIIESVEPTTKVSIRASLKQRGELIESLPSVLIEVSIRASLQQRGEPVGPAAIISPVAFQSAPHFSSEANDVLYFAAAVSFSVSIRASLQQRGERFRERQERQSNNVSIRASLQQRGEPLSTCNLLTSCEVSIRASLQQRGERLPSPLLSFEREVSIRASLQQRGEPAHYPIQVPWYSSFNPRLTSAARRTSVARMGETNQKEFQSAPHFSSEANRVRGNVVK